MLHNNMLISSSDSVKTYLVFNVVHTVTPMHEQNREISTLEVFFVCVSGM